MTVRIAILIGSVRESSKTALVAAFVGSCLKNESGVAIDLVDPRETNLVLPGLAGHDQAAAVFKQRFQATSGFIFVTPEYDGSFSSITKLQIEHLGYPSLLEGRVSSIVGVASGSIGAIKAVEHLKGVLSHVGSIVVPGSLSVARVHHAINDAGQWTDQGLAAMLAAHASKVADFIRNHGFGR